MNKKVKPEGVTVTLVAIVKNETHIIREMLESMIPYIDRYDITDTGSDDGTPELIKEIMDEHGIPGEVYLSDWKGFGKSRSEALENSQGKATYAWMIDADDKVDGNFVYPKEMNADAYSLRLGQPSFSWYRNQIFRNDNPNRIWHYVGVLHEYATIKDADPKTFNIVKWEGDYYVHARTLGARNVGVDPKEKYSRDAEVLLSALTNEEDVNYEPDNERYQFYLAQSYFDSQQYEKAFEAYQKRIDMGRWDEEVWFSKFRLGIIKGIMGAGLREIIDYHLDAFEFRPFRAEPLYEISRIYRALEKPRVAWIYAKIGCELTYPQNDILFIAADVYDWKMVDEFASTAYYAQDISNGFRASEILMEKLDRIPESEHERIRNNYMAYKRQIDEANAQHQMLVQQQKAQQKAEKKQDRVNKSKKTTKTKSRRK